MPELLIQVERDFLHARAPTLCRIREWNIILYFPLNEVTKNGW
jgi:hypothetical protein